MCTVCSQLTCHGLVWPALDAIKRLTCILHHRGRMFSNLTRCSSMIDELSCEPSPAFALIDGVQGQFPGHDCSQTTVVAHVQSIIPKSRHRFRLSLSFYIPLTPLLYPSDSTSRRQTAGPNQALCYSHCSATTPMHVFLRFVVQQGKKTVRHGLRNRVTLLAYD
jgi:hypothetical protein